jgi:predicted MFS family arabinose efflux permease
MALLTPFGGIVADRSRRPRLVMAGGALLGAVLIAAVAAPVSPWLVLVAAGLLIALPPGPMGAALASGVGPGARAAAFAIFSISSNLGALLLPVAAGAMRDLTASATAAILTSAAALALAGLFSLAIRPSSRSAR